MSKSSSNLLEILDFRDQADSSRQEYRVRVKGQAGFFLHLCDIPLPLADISISGASVLSQAAGELDEKQILENCKLEADGHFFTGIRCQVMHRSIDTQGSLVCGMRWLNLSPPLSLHLEKLVATLRRQMFESVSSQREEV